MGTAPSFLHVFFASKISSLGFFPRDIPKLYGVFAPLSFLNYSIGKQIIDRVFGNTKWATKKQLLLSIIRLVNRDPYKGSIWFYYKSLYNWVVFFMWGRDNATPILGFSILLRPDDVRFERWNAGVECVFGSAKVDIVWSIPGILWLGLDTTDTIKSWV